MLKVIKIKTTYIHNLLENMEKSSGSRQEKNRNKDKIGKTRKVFEDSICQSKI